MRAVNLETTNFGCVVHPYDVPVKPVVLWQIRKKHIKAHKGNMYE
jgi:hypothetical protein